MNEMNEWGPRSGQQGAEPYKCLSKAPALAFSHPSSKKKNRKKIMEKKRITEKGTTSYMRNFSQEIVIHKEKLMKVI